MNRRSPGTLCRTLARTKASVATFAVVAAFALAGCGFHLREAQPLPFESMRVEISDLSEMGAALKRNIRASGKTRLAAAGEDAEAIFRVSQDQRDRIILSLNAAGRVRELQLRLTFGFRVVDKAGVELMPPQTIQVKRDLSYSDADVLAKEQEEALLYRDMQNDVVQQIMRRLAKAKKTSTG